MTYQGRFGVIGNYDGKLFTGFILSSRSEPDRRLELDRKRNRIWVAPGEELQKKIQEEPYTAIENLYPCLIGFVDKRGNPVSTSFNGRMNNRVEAMMKKGETAESSLRQILPVFPPIENDPRIGAVAYLDGDKASCYFGVYDIAEDTYLLVRKVEVDPGHALYIALTSCRDTNEIKLGKAADADEIAQQLFEDILSIPPEYGCGAGVCIIDSSAPSGFELGVYNKE